MISSRILLLLFALAAIASMASASNSTYRFRSYANFSNSSNFTNHTNHTNATVAPAFITFPSTPIFNLSHSSNHSNHSNHTNATVAPTFITFPSTPFFNFSSPSISSNHSNHSNHSNTTCTREIAGQTFDLCAFKHPINASLYVDRFAANFTLSFLNSSLADCNGTYGSSWMTARNSYGVCADVHRSPVFNLTRQYGESGLKIDYQLGGDHGKVSVHLICNRTAPHSAHLDFAFNKTSNSSLTMIAHSYYGCPVNSSGNATTRAFGRKFLEF